MTVHLKIKMAAINGTTRYISTISLKIGDCEQSMYHYSRDTCLGPEGVFWIVVPLYNWSRSKHWGLVLLTHESRKGQQGRGCGHPDPEIRSQNFFFFQFGLEINVTTAPRFLPWIRHWGLLCTSNKTLRVWAQMRKKPFSASRVDYTCAFSFYCHCILSIATIYSFYFRQFNQFKPLYRLKDALRMIFITLIISKLPFN